MSLLLFANYENTRNSSIFYRLTSNTPYTFTLKLSETDSTISNSYIAEYSIDDDSNRILFSDDLTAFISLTAATPHVRTISVTAFNDQDFTLTSILNLSAVFVTKFLSANYIAYPQGFLNPYAPKYRYNTMDPSRYPTEDSYLVDLSANNRSNSFYGEGLTESVGLSTNTLYTDCSAIWKVGPYSVTTKTRTASALIHTTSDTTAVYPTSLQLYNNTFVQNGPTVAYFEVLSGTPSYYPFYSSSVNVDGTQKTSGGTFSKSLSVLKYPEARSTDFAFNAPLTGTVDLPLDSSAKIFTSSLVSLPFDNSLFSQVFYGSYWSINATANPQGINPDWFLTTSLLSSSIQNFRFQLGYYNQNNIDNVLLRASVGYPTSLNFEVSAIKIIQSPPRAGSDRFGSSWQAKSQYVPFQATAVISPLPVTNLYVTNYYNLTGTNVYFTNVWSGSSSRAEPLNTVVQFDTLSSSPLADGLSGEFQLSANNIGVSVLSAVTTFRDANNDEYSTKYSAPGVFECVGSYDDVETNHFKSEISPLLLTNNTAPRLTPNEWVTEDNVNSIIDKFSVAIEELDQYSSLYSLSSTKVTGRLKQTYYTTRYTTVYTISTYDIPDGSILSFVDDTPITTFEIPLSSLTTFTTTTSLCAFNEFSRTYAEILPGLEYEWVSSSVSPIEFDNWPIPSSDASLFYKGFVVLPKSNQIVVGYSDHINLTNNTYTSPIVTTEIAIDEIFSFQNIQAIGTTSQDYVVVLDSAFPRVSVYTIANNKFSLFTTWGRFGYQTSDQGLNKPRDLHIDQLDLVWVADTGNNCIKKFTINGKNLLKITHEYLEQNPPLSVCVDSEQNIHVLTSNGIFVFDSKGVYIFQYTLPDNISGPVKINTSYNRESIYITHSAGVIKYFRTGVIYQYLFHNQIYRDINNIPQTLEGYNSIFQDEHRNVYITVKDQVVRIADLMKLKRYKAQSIKELLWTADQLHVHKEEYVQPWVYLKSFHRMWDNIELFRNSLLYNIYGRRLYTERVYDKSQLIIGQNEIVSNAVINRICNQLWTNLRTIINYFDPNYVAVAPTPVSDLILVPTPTPTITLTEGPTLTPTPTPTLTPTGTPPADGIVQINDPSVYFVSDTGVYMVSGAKIV